MRDQRIAQVANQIRCRDDFTQAEAWHHGGSVEMVAGRGREHALEMGDRSVLIYWRVCAVRAMRSNLLREFEAAVEVHSLSSVA